MTDTVLFKMIVTELKRSILLFTFVSLMNLTDATTTIGISVTEVKTGDPFSITCSVSELSQDVIFKKGDITIGRCLASVAPGLLPGLCATGFSQDIATNITTYDVTSANATVDEGSWTCEHQPETSNALSLVVYGFPANPIVDNQAYLPNNIDTTNMDSTQFTVNVSECVNPAPTISWTFFQDCEGTSITLISITSTSSEDPDVGCSSPYSAYKNTVKVTDMKKVVGGGDYCYRVRSVVEYPGTSFINKTVQFSQNITFTSKSPDSPKSNIPTIIGVVVACIVLIVVIVVLIIYFKVYKRKGHQSKSKDKDNMLVPSAQKIPVGTDTKFVPSAQKTPVVPGTQIGPQGTEGQPHIDYHKGMPLEPEGPLKIKTRQDHVEFKWKPPKSDGGSLITNYIVEVHGIKFDTWEPFASSPKIKLQVPMDKFKNGEVMSFRVRAENENGSSKPLLAQEPFKLQNSHDILSDRPVVTNQGRGPAGQGSLLDEVPSDRKLPKPE